MIRVYGSAIANRSFFTSTIRGASGPIRYNPQVPASAKPTRTTDHDAAASLGVSHSRPRWKQRASDVRKQEDQDKQIDPEATDSSSAELQRLKTELQSRDSSTHFPSPSSQKREKILPATAAILDLTKSPKRSGLFYGDGRKFEALLTESNLFEAVETEEDQKLAKEKQAAKNYALRLLGIA